MTTMRFRGPYRGLLPPCEYNLARSDRSHGVRLSCSPAADFNDTGWTGLVACVDDFLFCPTVAL